MDAPPVITLTTDFGTSDPYVGVMKGVILGINPRASIVDIGHQVQPQSIQEGAFIIGTSHRFFPKGTIHVVVVDPGVGTSRSALLLVTPLAYFLAPDNGVLSYILQEGFCLEPKAAAHVLAKGQGDSGAPVQWEGSQVGVHPGYRAYHLTNPEFWLHPVSATFHGRDIFAPVAAHLSLGVPAHRLGVETRHLTSLPHRLPRRDGDMLIGEVVHVDHFGNLITNIPASLLPQQGTVTIEVKGRRIVGLSRSYAEGVWLLAIVGSHGNLEVSVRDGNAAQMLEVKVGHVVRVVLA